MISLDYIKKATSIAKKEKEALELLEDAYANKYKYIEVERRELGLNKKARYYVTIQCNKCKLRKTMSMEALRGRRYSCDCEKGDNTIEASAKRYAYTLYSAIKAEGEGMLVGKELEEYVYASVMYDRSNMCSQRSDYAELVQDYIEDLYEEVGVRRCRHCGIWLPYRSMYLYDKTCCKKCGKKGNKK